MKKKWVSLLLAFVFTMIALGAAAEEKPVLIQSCEMLKNAFTVLEEGNPFVERYNRITGENVKARMAQGAPYFWGAQEDHLFAKEPEYVVVPAWQDSPAYYKTGVLYMYGFDCVGFVKWAWKETYGQDMPARASLFKDTANQIRNTETGEGPLWDGCLENLIPGDLLLLEHTGGGHHIAIYMGTLRMYGYTAEEVPELADRLDVPLVIHCTTNAQVSDRFADLIAHGLPKYHCATVTDGGVCVSLLVNDPENAPGFVHQQNQDTRYYTLPDGTWLTVEDCGELDGYCWYRRQLTINN